MITIRQAQEQRGVSYLTIKRKIDAGKIKAEKINDVWMMPEEELVKLPKPRKPRGVTSSEHVKHVESGFLQGNPFQLIKDTKTQAYETYALHLREGLMEGYKMIMG